MNVLVYSGPEVLQSSLSRSIAVLRSTLSYVENGGAFLGLRAGATVGTSLFNVIDPSDYSLRFQDQKSGNTVYCKFFPGGEDSCRSVNIEAVQGGATASLLESGAVEFDGIETAQNAQVIARIMEDRKVVAASLQTSSGRVAFWGVHFETAVTTENTSLSADDCKIAEEKRQEVVRDTLRKLGLTLPSLNESGPSYALPQLLTSAPSRPEIVVQILNALNVQPPASFKDVNDTFNFHVASEAEELMQQCRFQQTDNLRHIVAFTDGSMPSRGLTPLFDIGQYYSDLADATSRAGCPMTSSSWGAGEAFMYGEVVTSTQTLLDKNPRFLSSLPSPLLSLATHQIAGRGRGGNSWVSPVGCLQFSLRLRVALSTIPPARLVFVQYLFALAVVEACRDDGVLGSLGDKIRLKWPNDIYIVGDDENEKATKVAGILVYTTFDGNDVDIVIGCGVNVLNPPPIASLASLIPSGVDRKLSMERTAAIIMAKFQSMWTTFLAHKGSFDPFMDLYLGRWLHSDSYKYDTPSPGGGYAGSQGFIDLQPDGNTFDLMSGLIMMKAR
ncbi:hypothetical protein EW026_g756 [Hermanssonia centrifuga]|uniref:BPL/LPL catalytic domain-containing protein n=1 Tax=Hermanssonia centrifuga TaxID=98765 RepID=A0A4S4KUP4_9APHY|nr:hypothetical protein EW026_g756 [Hermanssonia centrifuga]